MARVHPYTISFISAGLLHHDLQSSLVTIMSYIYIYISHTDPRTIRSMITPVNIKRVLSFSFVLLQGLIDLKRTGTSTS